MLNAQRMSGACKGRRNQARATLFNGWEASGRPLSSAICTLAGNTATNSVAVAQVPKRRVYGNASSAAHATSHATHGDNTGGLAAQRGRHDAAIRRGRDEMHHARASHEGAQSIEREVRVTHPPPTHALY